MKEPSGVASIPLILSSTDCIPKLIRERLEDIVLHGEPILLAAEADLDSLGHILPVWLLATKGHVVVVPAVSEMPVKGPYDYKAITDFDIHPSIGSTSLRLFLKAIPVELVRFTNENRERFQRVLTQLKRLKEGLPIQEDALFIPDPKFCLKCGLILPRVGAPCSHCVQRKAAFSQMFSMLAPYRWTMLGLFLLMIVGIALDLLPPFLTRILVDDVLTTRQHADWLLFLVIALAGASLLRRGIDIIINYLAPKVGTGVTNDIRKRLFQKLQEMSVAYYDRVSVGQLMSRITSDVEVMHGFVIQVTQGFLVNVFLVIAIGSMLFYMNPKLAILVLIPIPFVFIGTVFFWKRIYPNYYKYWDSNSKLGSMLNGVLSGIRLVKVFGQEKREARRFFKAADYVRETRIKVDTKVGIFSPLMAYVFGLGGLIVWFVGGRDVLNGWISLGTLMAFLGYIAMFYAPLGSLAMFSNWVTQFATASQRIFEILDMPSEVQDEPDAISCPHISGAIEMSDVWFGYDPYNPVIKGISLKIKAGEKIGIVGRSGSGKTTLVNLLCRFYEIQRGEIKIDGVSVRRFKRPEILQQIGLVLQEPFLFRGSIKDNLAYGMPGAGWEDILNASRAANCHDFIMKLPEGYDTQLGERGAGLSGGEKQRVSIARALLCNPRILILDEATSSVDTESEREIQRALRIIGAGRTVISIAHRLSTLKDANRIYVIDSGRLVEFGAHEELMKRPGVYYKLVKIQTELASLDLD
ncbi:MAG: ABC transporter ATP-binding protein [Candidatus Omnitrophota bacterium]|nr:ABC transporter ATP-binding protein/permease [Candidatus Omnitrophota bacterium]